MADNTNRKRNRTVSLAAKDGGDEAPPMSVLAAQHASEQLLVAAMGSARFSAAAGRMVEAAEVAKLVAAGGPLDELVNIALVQSNKHHLRRRHRLHARRHRRPLHGPRPPPLRARAPRAE